jgi:hypothetical protein
MATSGGDRISTTLTDATGGRLAAALICLRFVVRWSC